MTDLSGADMRIAELEAKLANASGERDLYRQHSEWLNSIGWKIGAALGHIPPGVDAFMANPVGQVEELISQHDRLGRRCAIRFGEREEARAALAQAREELNVLHESESLAEVELARHKRLCVALEAQRDKVLRIHHEYEGWCVYCIRECQCPDEATVGSCSCNTSIEWPCPTAAIYATADSRAEQAGGETGS